MLYCHHKYVVNTLNDIKKSLNNKQDDIKVDETPKIVNKVEEVNTQPVLTFNDIPTIDKDIKLTPILIDESDDESDNDLSEVEGSVDEDKVNELDMVNKFNELEKEEPVEPLDKLQESIMNKIHNDIRLMSSIIPTSVLINTEIKEDERVEVINDDTIDNTNTTNDVNDTNDVVSDVVNDTASIIDSNIDDKVSNIINGIANEIVSDKEDNVITVNEVVDQKLITNDIIDDLINGNYKYQQLIKKCKEYGIDVQKKKKDEIVNILKSMKH